MTWPFRKTFFQEGLMSWRNKKGGLFQEGFASLDSYWTGHLFGIRLLGKFGTLRIHMALLDEFSIELCIVWQDSDQETHYACKNKEFTRKSLSARQKLRSKHIEKNLPGVPLWGFPSVPLWRILCVKHMHVASWGAVSAVAGGLKARFPL